MIPHKPWLPSYHSSANSILSNHFLCNTACAANIACSCLKEMHRNLCGWNDSTKGAKFVATILIGGFTDAAAQTTIHGHHGSRRKIQRTQNRKGNTTANHFSGAAYHISNGHSFGSIGWRACIKLGEIIVIYIIISWRIGSFTKVVNGGYAAHLMMVLKRKPPVLSVFLKIIVGEVQ
jgi:hypothetical protein